MNTLPHPELAPRGATPAAGNAFPASTLSTLPHPELKPRALKQTPAQRDAALALAASREYYATHPVEVHAELPVTQPASQSLESLRDALRIAELAVNNNAEAAARGRAYCASMAATVSHYEAVHLKAQATAAKVLADSLTRGGDPERPTAMLTDEYKIVAASREQLATAGAALASLDDILAASMRVRDTAKRALETFVDAMDLDEEAQDARLVLHHIAEAVRLGTALLARAVNNEMHGRAQSPEATEALAKLDLPLIDRRHIAINLMKDGDLEAAAQRSARRAALLAGEIAA